ncbi:superoxide dismutase family protein [Sulfitobacter sp. HNIBRBA3233]|uniref:superoxide dismutase family protein n=1 Tax=Sulfitobacter marinivivus TaxID=3158558 RepID=UPI0032DEE885
MTRTIAALLASAALGAGMAHADSHVSAPTPAATAEMRTLDGTIVGTATLTPGTDGVVVHLSVEGLEPGAKGVHLHAVAECDPATEFKSAGGHIGDSDSTHGLLHPEGPHAGDLPNLYVGADGKGEMQAFTARVALSETPDGMLDSDGASLMIHASGDDHFTQPGGTTGARLACGAFQPTS